MSCTDGVPSVEREIVLPVPPEEVWDALPAILGDDVDLAPEPGGRVRATGPEGARVGLVEDADSPRRLVFWWVPVEGDDPPSRVELELAELEVAGVAVGTLLRVRESRFDAAEAVESLLGGPLARTRA